MTPNKEKELRNHLKTLDKDQLIELLLQFKCDAELLQGVANDTLDTMNEKLVLEKALGMAVGVVNLKSNHLWTVEEFMCKARESLKNEKN